MPVDVNQTLRTALSRLQSERARLDHQITALRGALSGSSADGRPRVAGRRRRRMSADARRAVSVRMKRYWAERRKAKAAKATKAPKGKKVEKGS